MTKKILMVVGICFLLALSFIYGVRVGGISQQYLDAPFKAKVLVHELRLLHQSRIEGHIKEMKEIELNQMLYYSDILINSYHRYLWPEFDMDQVTESLKYVAQYRRDYPYNFELSGNSDIMEIEKAIQSAVKKYENM